MGSNKERAGLFRNISSKFKQDRATAWLVAGILLFWAAGVAVAVSTPAIGDNGDSLVHYFFARYAYRHPGNFLDLWAKPVFVVLAAPFAQFGFAGIKVFNVTVAALSLWLVYDAARLLGLRYPALAAAVLASCTFYLKLMFSGLTEHLFACWLMGAVVLLLRRKPVSAMLLLSFLPFVRSEGFIVIGALVPYLLYARYGRYLPLLAIGYLVVGMAGALYSGDLLWILHQDTYPLQSSYGHGPLTHFIVLLYYVMGLINYVLLGLGLAAWLMGVIRPVRLTWVFLLLVLFPFGAFVVAHSLFWYLGIFHSMGLERVLNAVMPLAALIGCYGVSQLAGLLPRLAGRTLVAILFAGVTVFPFTGHISTVQWRRDLDPGGEARAVQELAGYVRQHYPDYRYCYASPLFTYAMDMDCYDRERVFSFQDYRDRQLPPHTVVLWDGAFALVEFGIHREQLDADTTLHLVKQVVADDTGIEFVLYAPN